MSIVFPYGVDSLRLHIVCDWSELPEAAGPVQQVRGYAYHPSAPAESQGWDWYIYIQPTDSLPLVAELLAHEASHIVDALECEWGGDPAGMSYRMDTESRAYMVQSIVHEATNLVAKMNRKNPKEEPTPDRKVHIYARKRGAPEWQFIKTACWCAAFEVMAAIEAEDPEMETKME